MPKTNKFSIKNLLRLLKHEILSHFHYSLIAVSLGMIFVWLLSKKIDIYNINTAHDHIHTNYYGNDFIFHVMHYAHTFFASMTATLTSIRHRASNLKSFLVGVFIPPFFCTLSDILFPYWGGKLIGIEMDLHLCVLENWQFVMTLIVLGAAFGFMASKLREPSGVLNLAIGSHFAHDYVSAAASLLYLVGFGYSAWTSNLVYVFLLMLVAVIVPCMMSDLILPIIICAKPDNVFNSGKSTCVYTENTKIRKNR